MKHTGYVRAAFLLFFLIGSPTFLWACACGYNAFHMGINPYFPTTPSTSISLEYAYLNQDLPWKESSRVETDIHSQEAIQTQFITASFQHYLNPNWTLEIALPFWSRQLTETEDSESVSHRLNGIADLVIKGFYTGFDPNMSSGLVTGIKLPTGPFRDFGERDTQIGSGSTDVILGAYQVGEWGNSGEWNWFVNGQGNLPILVQDQYRPGSEINTSLGISTQWDWGEFRVQPLLQVLGTYKFRDSGDQADSVNSGYRRAAVGLGLSSQTRHWQLQSNLALPFFTYVNGDQVIAPQLFSVKISYFL